MWHRQKMNRILEGNKTEPVMRTSELQINKPSAAQLSKELREINGSLVRLTDEMGLSAEMEEDASPENLSEILGGEIYTRKKKILLKKQIGN